MEDPRAELKYLVQATRALMEYTREASPEGAYVEKLQAPPPREVRPKVSQAPEVIRAEAPRVEISPEISPPKAEATGPVGFKDLFASLGEPAGTPAKPATKAPVKAPALALTPTPTPAKPEPARGPLSKAKVIEVLFEDRMKNQNALEEISSKARKCEACKLCKTRNSVVWGVGPAFAPLMFIGEGPGENEDRQGVPFVGAAGQLLDKIITATGFSREDIYIANCVKCRPPGNRNPEPDELEACAPYLNAQIELVSPRVIVALGRFAAQVLLQTQAPISKLRGVVNKYNKTPLVATFHPAYLLRNPGDKRLVWEDMQVVRRVYDELVG
jgi:uracil-DNA glycosylase